MSFGYGVGDIITVTTLAWRALQNTRQACGQYDELTREVSSLHIVLNRLQLEAKMPTSLILKLPESEGLELGHIIHGCKEVLKVLNSILAKYSTLGEEKGGITRLLQRVRFGNGEMQDLTQIRSQLSGQTASIALFLQLMSLGSQGRVERQMAAQLGALQEMQKSTSLTTRVSTISERASSILTTYENDDKDFWKQFRRELIAEGCSSDVMTRHRDLIVDYIRELQTKGIYPIGEKSGDEISQIDPVPIEVISSGSFDPNDEKMNLRIYTRIMGSASVRNSFMLPELVSRKTISSAWPNESKNHRETAINTSQDDFLPFEATPKEKSMRETHNDLDLQTWKVVSNNLEPNSRPLSGAPSVNRDASTYEILTSEAQTFHSEPLVSYTPPRAISPVPESTDRRVMPDQFVEGIGGESPLKMLQDEKPPPSPRAWLESKTIRSSPSPESASKLGRDSREVFKSTEVPPEVVFSKSFREHTIVVMGARGVDKSSLVTQLVHDNLMDSYDSQYDSIINDSYRKEVVIDDQVAVLEVLDTSGVEEFLPLQELYMQAGGAFMLVYSITSRHSFELLLVLQQQILCVKNKDNFPMIIVGNHCEREGERKVLTSEALKLARSFNYPFCEVSSSQRINTGLSFFRLVREIRRWEAEQHSYRESPEPPTPTVTPDAIKTPRSRGGLKEFLRRRPK